MLSESFIAASSAPPRLVASNSTLLKDAGIFVHSFQPQPTLRTTFKKSTTAANCLAISPTHIFAAQSDKAAVYVYHRETGKHEATVPFPERIHSVALALKDTVLALGTEGGSILIWDTTTGRQTWTPQSHLQAVTTLAIDSKSAFMLSGSTDSTVLVWSLRDLLSFSTSSSSDNSHTPRHSLSTHRAAIVALQTGHSTTTANIAVATSADSTASIWNYHTGTLLRTVLLAAAPLCAVLDPADRGFYVGLTTGGVQCVDFYTQNPISVHDSSLAMIPLQPPAASHWQPANNSDGQVLSISLSYDGTTVLTGHTSGAILAWDVASSASMHFRSRLAEHAGAPITNIKLLPPIGFRAVQQDGSLLRLSSVVKPRPHDTYSSPAGRPTGAWRVTAQLPKSLKRSLMASDDFEAVISRSGFSNDFLSAALVELAECSGLLSAPPLAATAGTATETADMISLDSAGATREAEDRATITRQAAQIEHLKNLQKVAHAQLAKLAKEKADSRDN